MRDLPGEVAWDLAGHVCRAFPCRKHGAAQRLSQAYQRRQEGPRLPSLPGFLPLRAGHPLPRDCSPETFAWWAPSDSLGPSSWHPDVKQLAVRTRPIPCVLSLRRTDLRVRGCVCVAG